VARATATRAHRLRFMSVSYTSYMYVVQETLYDV
jgi:hypothetical protein